MKRFKNILVSADVRYDDHPSVTEAAKIAVQSGAKLTLIDVIPKGSFFARLAVDNYEHLIGLLHDETRSKLEELAQPMRDQGIKVSTNVYQGQTSTEIIRHVLRDENDLVMRTTKARGSRESGFFGRTSSRLLRKCPCPLWLMQPEKTLNYKQILACVDTTTNNEIDQKLNDLVCKLAQEISSYHETHHSIVHAWTIWNQQMLMHRMSKEDFDTILNETKKQEVRLFARFLERHDGSLGDDNVHLLEGDPHLVIPALADKLGVDLIVMGTVGRSGVYGSIMGNTAESILKRVHCDVLAVKPEDFCSPIKLAADPRAAALKL